MELFNQAGPTLDNQYKSDPYLPGLIAQFFHDQAHQEIDAKLHHMGELAGKELYQLQLADRLNEPVLTQWDPWGKRIDQIELTPLWKKAEQVTVDFGLISLPYTKPYGALSRLAQFALVYLFTPSNDIYSCPLAMTDGAARTLIDSENQHLIEQALPHLTSPDYDQFWTSGQWMTELTGGSDVGQTESIARLEDGQWKLYGRKWFTSATTSQMALTLAKPEGNGPGGKGLALFYLEPRNAQGELQGIEINRLKDKLGTRKVPTAELLLSGTPATLVSEDHNGIKNITPMLNITRTWNAVSALGLMRRGLNLAWDYAQKRRAFGAQLIDKPLHRETLLNLEAEFAGAFYLTFEMIHLLGRQESGELSPAELAFLRLLTPIVKLTTGKQSVAVLSEVLESFGGAGYVEDTGLPVLLRDAQVLPIWEGTTNVLSLDSLRVLTQPAQAKMILEYINSSIQNTEHPVVKEAQTVINKAFQWLGNSPSHRQLEMKARHFALTLGRSFEVLAMGRQLHKSNLQTSLPIELDDLIHRYVSWQALYLGLE